MLAVKNSKDKQFDTNSFEWLKMVIFAAHLPLEEYASSQRPEYTEYKNVSPIRNRKLTIERQKDLPEKSNGRKVRPHAVLNPGFFQIKAFESRRGGSKPPVALELLHSSRVVRAVRGLPEDQLNWVRYAYTNNYTWDHEQGIALILWERFIDRLPKKYEGKPPKVLQGLAYLILQDFKHRCNTGKKLYTVKRLQELLKANSSNWRRDYSPKIKLLCEVLYEIDQYAMKALDKIV